MKTTLILSIVLVCILTGCATDQRNLSRYFRPNPYMQKAAPPTPASNVKGVIVLNSTPEKVRREISRLGNNGYWLLGEISLMGPSVTQIDIQRAVAKVGGDFYVYATKLRGMNTGTRMVPIAYTSPTSINSTSQGYGSGMYSGNYSGIYGPNTVNGTASTSAYSSTQTFVGGTTTYGREQFQYPVFDHDIVVMSSPGLTDHLLKIGAIRQQ